MMRLSFPNLLDNGERLKIPTARVHRQYYLPRADRERAHELSPILSQGASLLPPPIQDMYATLLGISAQIHEPMVDARTREGDGGGRSIVVARPLFLLRNETEWGNWYGITDSLTAGMRRKSLSTKVVKWDSTVCELHM